MEGKALDAVFEGINIAIVGGMAILILPAALMALPLLFDVAHEIYEWRQRRKDKA